MSISGGGKRARDGIDGLQKLKRKCAKGGSIRVWGT